MSPQNAYLGMLQKAFAKIGELRTPELSLSNSAFTEKRTITANSTGFVLTAQSALPTTDEGAAFSIVSNSTGVALVVNSTGTTWNYLNVTSVQPT